jgi:hypothetical protein
LRGVLFTTKQSRFCDAEKCEIASSLRSFP